MKGYLIPQESIAPLIRASRGVAPRKVAPVTNDDDITTRIHRELIERDPENLSLRRADIWKLIRGVVRRWREGQGAETQAQVTLFGALDDARRRGVIR